jgi:hypothetical protein
MSEFKEIDLVIHSQKFPDGRRRIVIDHLPTGLSVDEFVKPDESSLRTRERLMAEIKRKVASVG